MDEKGASSTTGEAAAGPAALAGLNRIWLRRAGVTVGLVLLVAAVVLVVQRRDLIGDALAEVRHPSWPHAALLLVCVALNTMLSGVVFHQLVSRYGRVGVGEMQALIAAMTLVNYLPLRPGLFGRLAYHKTRNDIPLSDSAKTVVQAFACTAIAAVYLVAALGLGASVGVPIWITVITPLPVLVIAGAMSSWRHWLWALAARYLEVQVWAVRYWAAFTLLGVELSPEVCLAIAVIACFTMMVPFVSNGLGLREWAIGLTAPLFADQVATMEIGITAELVNRAAELVVISGMGVIGMAVLTRMKKRTH